MPIDARGSKNARGGSVTEGGRLDDMHHQPQRKIQKCLDVLFSNYVYIFVRFQPFAACGRAGLKPAVGVSHHGSVHALSPPLMESHSSSGAPSPRIRRVECGYACPLPTLLGEVALDYAPSLCDQTSLTIWTVYSPSKGSRHRSARPS